jgi:chromosome segregation ATPase
VTGQAIAEKTEQHERERGILLDEIAKGELREQEFASQNDDLRNAKAAVENTLTDTQAELAASRHEVQRVQAQLDESRTNLDNLVRGLSGGQGAKQGGSSGSSAPSDLPEQAKRKLEQSNVPNAKRRGRPPKNPTKPVDGQGDAN